MRAPNSAFVGYTKHQGSVEEHLDPCMLHAYLRAWGQMQTRAWKRRPARCAPYEPRRRAKASAATMRAVAFEQLCNLLAERFGVKMCVSRREARSSNRELSASGARPRER